MTWRLLDIFSGIGGFSLGLERSGYFKTVAFCEIEAYPRRVLAKHWPEVPCYDDIRTLSAERLAADGIAVDAICGGFPCQDISVAGKGAGLAGERSGLWREYARLIGEIRPRIVIVENVSALLSRGLGDVLSDLASLGYDAEWHCIPASAVGAPHRRDRLWVVAYSDNSRSKARHIERGQQDQQGAAIDALPCCSLGSNPESNGRAERRKEGVGNDTQASGTGHRKPCGICGRDGTLADADITRLEGRTLDWSSARQCVAMQSGRSDPGKWLTEPGVGRVANGVSKRVDRLKGLGNAVVPQVVELIGVAVGRAFS
jgi:DNA (cytosine-5)-methyltransferase 1